MDTLQKVAKVLDQIAQIEQEDIEPYVHVIQEQSLSPSSAEGAFIDYVQMVSVLRRRAEGARPRAQTGLLEAVKLELELAKAHARLVGAFK